MAEERKGGPIIKTDDLDALVRQGESSQQRREQAMKKHREEEQKKQKEEDMQKIVEDAGTVSQQERGRGV
jgi:hypothetical protein